MIESINKSTVNEFRIPRAKVEQHQPVPTFNPQNQHEHQNPHQSFRFWQHLQTSLNIEQGEIHQILAKETYMLLNLALQSQKKIFRKSLVLKQLVNSRKHAKLNYLCAQK